MRRVCVRVCACASVCVECTYSNEVNAHDICFSLAASGLQIIMLVIQPTQIVQKGVYSVFILNEHFHKPHHTASNMNEGQQTQHHLDTSSCARRYVQVVHEEIGNSGRLAKFHYPRQLEPAQRLNRSDEAQLATVNSGAVWMDGTIIHGGHFEE